MVFLQATVALPTGLTFTGTSTATAPLASGSTEAAVGDESLSSTSSRLSGNYGRHQAPDTVSQLATPDTESSAAVRVSTEAGFQKLSVSSPNLEAGRSSTSSRGDKDDWFKAQDFYGTDTSQKHVCPIIAFDFDRSLPFPLSNKLLWLTIRGDEKQGLHSIIFLPSFRRRPERGLCGPDRSQLDNGMNHIITACQAPAVHSSSSILGNYIIQLLIGTYRVSPAPFALTPFSLPVRYPAFGFRLATPYNGIELNLPKVFERLLNVDPSLQGSH
ncbi:hypothetical protein EV360DRAFT_65469 [Lentinula raphanica]|nr:hypothetical protein EV360DRAFT_65469 [Lentinula raphanica]